jgi:hypothetical protein
MPRRINGLVFPTNQQDPAQMLYLTARMNEEGPVAGGELYHAPIGFPTQKGRRCRPSLAPECSPPKGAPNGERSHTQHPEVRVDNR